jgi:hypothetical protein
VSALGAGELLAAAAPREATDPSVQHWWSMFVHTAASPAELYDGIKSLGPVDIHQLLGSIHLPVLVLHRTGDRLADVRQPLHGRAAPRRQAGGTRWDNPDRQASRSARQPWTPRPSH